MSAVSPLQKEQSLELCPYSRVSPVLGEDVCRIHLSWDVVKSNHLRRNSFPDAVEGKHGVSLVEFGVYSHAAVDNRLVVTKQIALLPNRNTQVP